MLSPVLITKSTGASLMHTDLLAQSLHQSDQRSTCACTRQLSDSRQYPNVRRNCSNIQRCDPYWRAVSASDCEYVLGKRELNRLISPIIRRRTLAAVQAFDFAIQRPQTAPLTRHFPRRSVPASLLKAYSVNASIPLVGWQQRESLASSDGLRSGFMPKGPDLSLAFRPVVTIAIHTIAT